MNAFTGLGCTRADQDLAAGTACRPASGTEGERTARSLPDRGSCEENVTAAYSVPFVRMEAPDAHPDQGGRVGGRRRDAGRGDAAGATARGRRERTHVAAGGAIHADRELSPVRRG